MKQQHHHGFSLIESVVVLILMGIVLVMSLPSFKSYLLKTQNDILASTILNTLAFAHQAALTRHAQVGVRIRETDISIFLVAGSGLLRHALKSDGGKLHWRAYPYYRDYIQFDYRGNLMSDNATVWYCANNGLPIWEIVLGKHAQARLKTSKISMSCK